MAYFAHFAVVARHGILASAEIITTKNKKTERAAYRAKLAKKRRASPPEYDIGSGLGQCDTYLSLCTFNKPSLKNSPADYQTTMEFLIPFMAIFS